jgi:urea transporter
MSGMANIAWGQVAWANIITGAIFIIGLAFIASRAFGEFALAATSQGVMWKTLLGEKWAAVAVRFVFRLISIAAGVWVIYAGIYGYD